MRTVASALARSGLIAVLFCAFESHAQVIWNAFDDFYVNVPATGGNNDYNQSTWIANGGNTTPNAWGYAGGNFNGAGAPASVGTYVSGGNFYALTSGGAYAGPGVSYNLGGGNYWIGYNDQYGIVGLPNANTQIGKYTSEWFGGTPNYATSPGGSNNKFLWLQGTGLSPSTDGLGALLTWTAPTSGTFQISGSYVNGNYGGVATSFAIVDSGNNTLLSKQTLAAGSTETSFNFTASYSAGDVIQFQAAAPAAAQGSPLGLAVNISQIPEPSSGALLAGGLGILSLFRLRRRY